MENTLEQSEELKTKARKVYRSALKSGELVRADACANCGDKVELHGHHHDYGKPLAVVWLCTFCHALVHNALNGFKPKRKSPTGRPLGSRSKTALSKRELEVLKLVCDGLRNREIAAALKIAVRTAETHRERIYKFTQTHNAAQIVRWALDHHLITL